jgi:O-antigen ligase
MAHAASAGVKQTSARIAAEESASQDSLARRIAWWALVAAVFLVPLATTDLRVIGFAQPFTYDQIDLAKLVVLRTLALVSIGAWAFDALAAGTKIRHTPVEWLILAFLGWAGITTVTSIDWQTSFFGKYQRYEGFLTFVLYAAIYFLALQFADRISRVFVLAKALVLSSSLIAFYGILQSFGLDAERLMGGRAVATFGNPDALGGLLVVALPIALALALAEKDVRWRIAYWIGFVLNGAALAFTLTRGSWIGGVVALVCMAVIALRQKVSLRRADWTPVAGAAVIGAAFAAQSAFVAESATGVGALAAERIAPNAYSVAARIDIWKAALSAIAARPILGFGADTFRFVFPQYKPLAYLKDVGYNNIADNAHNYLLQIGVSMGVVGVALLFGIFGWAAARSAKTVFEPSSDTRRMIVGGFWAAAAGSLAHLMFAPSVAGSTFLLWICLAVVLAPTASAIEVKGSKVGMAVALVVCALAVAGIGYQGVLLEADHAYLVANTTESVDTSVDAARDALGLVPHNYAYRTQVGLSYANQLLATAKLADEAQKAGQNPEQHVSAAQTQFTAGEAALRFAIAALPSDIENYQHLANLYNIGGELLAPALYDDAIQVARQGLTISPYTPALRVQLARALLATGKADEGLSEVRTALEQDPAYGGAAILLASVLQSQGNSAEALKVLKAVDAAKPGQADVEAAIQQLSASPTPAP